MDSQILPKIREDLTLRSEVSNGQELVIIIDPLGLKQEDIAIPLGFLPLVQMLDGLTTMAEIKQFLDTNLINSEEIIPLFRKVINVLDEYAMLETDTYFSQLELLDEYYANPIRPATLAGIAYAKDKEELTEDLDKILKHYPELPKITNASAVIVPHIDFYAGGAAQNCYSSAYKSIEDTQADLFVIFGTSHYYSSSSFMLTLKDFETPFGILQTDKEVIDEMAKDLEVEKYMHDAAHRLEHSIEMQTILIQRKFSNSNFKILPILCGFGINQSDNPTTQQEISKFIIALKDAIAKLGRKVVFIASADLSHIGVKHNSPLTASDNRIELERADRELISDICNLSIDDVTNRLKSECDKWQICGAAPIYSLMQIKEFSNAELEYYGQYLDYEFDSAVSFATISFQ